MAEETNNDAQKNNSANNSNALNKKADADPIIPSRKQDNGYKAKRNNSDNGKNKGVSNNGESNSKERSKSPKTSSNDSSKPNNKENLKQKAAAAALSTVMPAPLAEGVSKLAVKNKQKQDEKKINDEKRRLHQSQDRLDQIRNAANKLDKKQQGEEENDDSSSLKQTVDDIKATAKNVSGFVKFLKMIPPAGWGVIVGSIFFLFFFLIVFFNAFSSSTVFASVLRDYMIKTDTSKVNNSQTSTSSDSSSENTSDSSSSSSSSSANTNPNGGKGKLGYPTTSRKISAGYPNYSDGSFHGGIDFPVAKGTSIYAAEAGEVIIAKTLNRSYGYYLYIKHNNGLCTLYAHNSKLLVSKGDKVKKGQEIAKSGSTGNASGPHCHFEVRTNCGVSSGGAPSGTHQNPNNYLSD